MRNARGSKTVEFLYQESSKIDWRRLQKLQKMSTSRPTIYKMGSKSITNETNLGQEGGKGQPKINENMKKYKKRKRKEAK